MFETTVSHKTKLENNIGVERKTDMIQSKLSDMAFTPCPACNQMRFDKKANRCNECGYQIS